MKANLDVLKAQLAQKTVELAAAQDLIAENEKRRSMENYEEKSTEVEIANNRMRELESELNSIVEQFNADLSSKDEEIRGLKSEIEALKSQPKELETSKTELIQLTSNNEEKTNLIETLNSRLTEYESLMSQLKEANEKLCSEKSALVQQHTNDLDSLQCELAQLNQKFEQSQNLINELQAKLSSESEIQSNLKVNSNYCD